MLDYNRAKPSFHIEEQLPSFVKADGEVFIEFLKTYYDWLERKIVMLDLKAINPITNEDLLLQEFVTIGETSVFTIELEQPDIGYDSTFLVAENQDVSIEMYEDYNSLFFNGISNYMTVYNNVLPTPSSDWSIGLWINLEEFPKVMENDMDVLTISNNEYFSLINLSESDNKLHLRISDLDVNTNLYLNKKQWYFIVIRYKASEQKFYYDMMSWDDSHQTFISEAIDLSSYSPNRFVLGFDSFSSESTGNFFNGKLDSVSTWDKFLDDTEIISLFNEGTAIDITENREDYVSSTDLTDFWRFETGNTTFALNSITPANGGDLYNNPQYILDTPFNLSVLITEFAEVVAGSYIYNKYLLLRIINSVKYEGSDNIEESRKLKVYAEHLSGKLSEDLTILSTANNTISIDTFTEMRNPINALNNVPNFQDIDYSYDYDNFVSGNYFQYLFNELMYGIPLYLHTSIDKTIKNIVGKEIKQLYQSKGTIDSIKYLFKILYNEDIEVVENDVYEYTIKTKKYAAQETKDIVKMVVHPVGYKVNFEPL